VTNRLPQAAVGKCQRLVIPYVKLTRRRRLLAWHAILAIAIAVALAATWDLITLVVGPAARGLGTWEWPDLF
jgi:hypothetical protein